MESTAAWKKMSDKISCRQILTFMVMSGFAANQMIRTTLPIAITAMVRAERNASSYNETRNVTDALNAYGAKSSQFTWSKYEQSLIFGTLFWGHIATELVGGRVVVIVGSKKTMGAAMLAASVLTIVVPMVSYLGVIPTAILRGALGMALGPTYPSIPPMATKWISPTDRSKFMSDTLASAFGAAVTLPVCGVLIERVGWPACFYFTGTVGLVWCVAWLFLVHDSPARHPRISDAERAEIEATIAEVTVGATPKSVPWRSLLTSGSAWALVIAQCCTIFVYLTMIYQFPTYMKEILHYSAIANGFLSTLPYLGHYIMTVIAAYVVDKMLKAGKHSTIFVRKSCTTVALVIPAVFMALQAIFGEDSIVSVAMFIAAMFVNGAHAAGDLVNVLDIAPNFSSTIMGIVKSITALCGYFSTVIVAALTNNSHSFQDWSHVFWILSGVYAFGAVSFLLLGSGKVQPWNSVVEKADVTELRLLNIEVKHKKYEFF